MASRPQGTDGRGWEQHMQVWPGHRYPLGATYDGTGTNFAIFSEVAEAVELCLFDPSGNERKVQLHEQDAFVWHAYLPGVEPGQRYGYRVYGPYDPSRGAALQPAQAAARPVRAGGRRRHRVASVAVRVRLRQPGRRCRTSTRRRTWPRASWSTRTSTGATTGRRDIPYHHSVIYEAHVKGLTERHPEVPEDMRGTYAAIGHPAIIEHSRARGHRRRADAGAPVRARQPAGRPGTAQLLGLQHARLLRAVPRLFGDGRARPADPGVPEHGQGAARRRHGGHPRRGLQPHGRGQPPRPDAQLQGHRQRTYYRLVDDQPHFYMDYTGTGNSLNVRSPQSLQLIMDSLRYWVTEMHVDGFRFDLASTLAREFLHWLQN